MSQLTIAKQYIFSPIFESAESAEKEPFEFRPAEIQFQ